MVNPPVATVPQLPHMVVARFSIATGVGVAMAVAAKRAEMAEMLNFMMTIVVIRG